MKKIVLALSLLTPAMSFAAICDATVANPCVVLDSQAGMPRFKNWRDNTDLYQAAVNKTGLADLWMSGSSAPSATGWAEIKSQIIQRTHHEKGVWVDLDLRQESHGYVNNDAVTLAVDEDWVNVGKTHHQVLSAEAGWLASLRDEATIPDVLTHEQFKEKLYQAGAPLSVQSVESEKDVVSQLGFHYVRLTVSDHRAPDPAEVDRFLTLMSQLPKDAWIHVHCRGGDGRTTTFMTMLDILRNANAVSLDDILTRQASVSPYYDLRDIKTDDPVLIPYYQARLAFIQQFYQYVLARNSGNTETWSAWLKHQ